LHKEKNKITSDSYLAVGELAAGEFGSHSSNSLAEAGRGPRLLDPLEKWLEQEANAGEVKAGNEK